MRQKSKNEKKTKQNLKSCWHDPRRLRNLAQKRGLVCFLKVPQLQSGFLTVRTLPLPRMYTHTRALPLCGRTCDPESFAKVLQPPSGRPWQREEEVLEHCCRFPASEKFMEMQSSPPNAPDHTHLRSPCREAGKQSPNSVEQSRQPQTEKMPGASFPPRVPTSAGRHSP